MPEPMPDQALQALHDAIHPGRVCATCPRTIAYRAALSRRPSRFPRARRWLDFFTREDLR